jgi:hypothetical protein
LGHSQTGFGVEGLSETTGVVGSSKTGYGVTGDGGGTFAGVKGSAVDGRVSRSA